MLKLTHSFKICPKISLLIISNLLFLVYTMRQYNWHTCRGISRIHIRDSGFYSVFDEISVLLRFPTLFFSAILFIREIIVWEIPDQFLLCSKRLPVSFTRLNANLGRVSRLDRIIVQLSLFGRDQLDKKVESSVTGSRISWVSRPRRVSRLLCEFGY